jgi:hypothetical protein
MAHARPFWTSTLQDLSNSIKNTSRQGVSSSKFLRVPEDSKFPLLGVRISSSHLPQSGVATMEEFDYSVTALILRCEGYTRRNKTLKHNFFTLLLLTLVDQMESIVRTRVLTLICCTMVISEVFFLSAMGELLKQAHTMWMALDVFLSMGNSIKLNWMGFPLTGMLQLVGACIMLMVMVVTQQAWAFAPWQIHAHQMPPLCKTLVSRMVTKEGQVIVT